MKNSSGLLIFFDKELRETLIHKRIDGSFGPFSDALSVYDWKHGQLGIALLSFSESTIDFIALVRKGKKVATSKHRANFSEAVDLNSVSITSLELRLKESIKPYFIRSSRGAGGTIPEKTWQRVLSLIKEDRPSLVGDIDRLLSLELYSGFHLNGNAADILLQERDALGSALDIFSGDNELRQQVLGAWAPDESSISEFDNDSAEQPSILITQPPSFMRGIPKQYIQEESALQHDLFNWDRTTPFHVCGRSLFEKGGRRLEIIYANRNSLEHTLGVDLIYYSQHFELFVLVQYKLMRKEGQQMVYRPDPQLNKELSRMDEFYNRYIQSAEIKSHNAYRLNSDGFFLKLVPNRGVAPASGELIKGMYLTREYAKFLLGANAIKGDRGGTVITFDDTTRYLTNTQFTQAVNGGWVGTRGIHSSILKELIKQYYETGRAVLFANETSKPVTGKRVRAK